jgi:hypothetical protein
VALAALALEQSRSRIDELASDGDHDGADTWRRITTAVEQRHDPDRCTDRNAPETVA